MSRGFVLSAERISDTENVVLRAVAMGEGEEVSLEDLPPEFLSCGLSKSRYNVRNFHKAMEETARRLCVEALAAAGGEAATAAQLMGRHRNSMYRMMRRYGIR